MATTYRAQVAVWHDSVSPADAATINPAFKVTGIAPADPQQLAQDLADAISTKMGDPTRKIRVRMYELPMVPPIIPKAEVNKGSAAPAASSNRDIALCLSYYCDTNTKRRRGRLYIPAYWEGTTAFASRPTTPQMSGVLAWHTIFTNLGGADVDWVLWSERDQTSHPVTNVYVDNEWDTVRSRGLKPSTRLTATTTEGNQPNLVALQPGALEPEEQLQTA